MRAAVITVFLAGCAGAAVAPVSRVSPVPSAPLSLSPTPRGLDVTGSGGREIGFGRAQAGALASAERVSGGTARAVPCGGGREAYDIDGIAMVFEGGRFVGWRTPDGAAGAGCPSA